MASINNISIKSLKKFKDHEGININQGNVYYKNKKLGFWTQDSWGGPDHFGFNTDVLDGEFEKYRNSDMVEDRFREYIELGSLFASLVDLMEDEKLYKKWAKQGCGTMVAACDGYHYNAYATRGSKAAVLKSDYYKEFVGDCRKRFFEDWDGKTVVYESLDDFNIEV